MLVFADIETTGLDPSRHQILELALIVTDDNLEEKARFSRVFSHRAAKDLSIGSPTDDAAVAYAAAHHSDIDPFVVRMHRSNGLWKDSHLAVYKEFIETEAEIVAMIAAYAVPGEKPMLAGNSVHFDRGFLAGSKLTWYGQKRSFPVLDALLHYRHFDCTTLNEFAKRFAPSVHAARPGANEPSPHRAMPDAENSLALARYYCSR